MQEQGEIATSEFKTVGRNRNDLDGLSSGAIRIVSRTMTTSLDITGDTAAFRYPPEYDDCVERFDNVLEGKWAGRLNAKDYLNRLRDLSAQHPWFIDVHAHIGNALLEQGKTGLALAAYQTGIALGSAAIPQGYSGLIEWIELENRPFLRAVHGATICHLRRRHWRKAIPLLEDMLAWNPKDNQGNRYLIGSVYLRAGKLDEASTALDLKGDLDPWSLYDLGLLLLIRQQYMAAATALRHGFIENGYIAEILCGMPRPLPLAIWHGSNLAEPENAEDYVEMFGQLWHRTYGAVAFLRWLHMNSQVMAERAAILQCREMTLWEPDPGRRREILVHEVHMVNGIDDRLSGEIVVKKFNRHGKAVWPWLHKESRY